MIKTTSDRWVALTVVVCSATLILALTVALGKISLGTRDRLVTARFGAVAGVNVNTTVKYAGAAVGRVKSIKVLPRSASVGKDHPYYIEMVLSVRKDLDLGQDVGIEVKQDGLLGAKYVALNPGAIDAPLLADDAILYGESPVELADLAGPGKALMTDLGPAAHNIREITARLNENMPVLIAKLDSVLANGDNLLSAVGTPEAKAQVQQVLRNIKVVSDNLKVVSTNAKAMTATLGERPWSLIWGGKPNQLPSEDAILTSDKPLPIHNSDAEATEAPAAKAKAKTSQP